MQRSLDILKWRLGGSVFWRVGKTVIRISWLARSFSLVRHKAPARTRCRNPTEAAAVWLPAKPVAVRPPRLATAQAAMWNASRPPIGQRWQLVWLHSSYLALAHVHPYPGHCAEYFHIMFTSLAGASLFLPAALLFQNGCMFVCWPLYACLSASTWDWVRYSGTGTGTSTDFPRLLDPPTTSDILCK